MEFKDLAIQSCGFIPSNERILKGTEEITQHINRCSNGGHIEDALFEKCEIVIKWVQEKENKAEYKETPERICDSCKYKGKSATIEMTTITRCHNPNVGVHEDDKRCEFYKRGTE